MVLTNGFRLLDADRIISAMNRSARPAQFPPVNVSESAEHYLLEADLPGRSLDTIHVHVQDQLLTIESKDPEETDDSEQTSATARARRPFRRSFSLPRDVDPGAITATYRDGVLRLDIPKRPESRPRSISISS